MALAAPEVEVALHTERKVEALGGDAEVVVIALRGPLGVGSQAETVGQLDVVVPDERDVWVVEGFDGAVSRRRYVWYGCRRRHSAHYSRCAYHPRRRAADAGAIGLGRDGSCQQ